MNITYKIAACDDEQIFVDDVVKKIKEQSEQCEISEYTFDELLLNSSLAVNTFKVLVLHFLYRQTSSNKFNKTFFLNKKEISNNKHNKNIEVIYNV